ncbi:MAG: hypothetical protein HY074_04110 [Deltaproteobacteria bacterium]|nr:hypothetical protein [Deltaproteobacteria bacterium]
MSRWLALISFLALFPFTYAMGDKVPFTSKGFASLKGKNMCTLEGEFPKELGVFLDLHKKHAVHYRERDGVIVVFLLSRPTLRCGVVDAVLDLTPLIRPGESPEFKCYTSHEGGTTWGKWGRVIGLADNQRGTNRFVKARLAWRVNIRDKRFEEIRGEKVECDTTGYAD